MANNYVQFSAAIEKLTAAEEEWLNHALRYAMDEITDDDGEGIDEKKLKALLEAEPWRDEENDMEYAPDFQWEFEGDAGVDRYLHIYAEESGSSWAAGQLARAFLEKFRPNDIWTLNWATYCDKMRIDNFGGGAVVATAKEVRATNSYEWVDRMVAHFKRTGELPKVRKFKKLKSGRFKELPEEEIIAERQWDDESLIIHLKGFIDRQGLRERYRSYLARCAYEEERFDLEVEDPK